MPLKRPRGGRPPLPIHRRRRHRILVSLTDAELAVLIERAELTSTSRARYLRDAALGRKLSSRIDRNALAQLARVGNLLNQLARYTHMTHRPADVEAELRQALRAIRQASGKLLDS